VASAPEPLARTSALPESQTGAKVKPLSKDAPPVVAEAPAVGASLVPPRFRVP
jgi:hypothetical protein